MKEEGGVKEDRVVWSVMRNLGLYKGLEGKGEGQRLLIV